MNDLTIKKAAMAISLIAAFVVIYLLVTTSLRDNKSPSTEQELSPSPDVTKPVSLTASTVESSIEPTPALATASEPLPSAPLGATIQVNAICAANGPLSDVQVRITREGLQGNYELVAAALTDREGRALMEVPVGGPYVVSGRMGERTATTTSLWLGPSTHSVAELLFLKPQEVIIKCVDEANVPIKNIRVIATDGLLDEIGSRPYQDPILNNALTDEAGVVRFKTTLYNMITIIALGERHYSTPQEVRVLLAPANEIVFRMQQAVPFVIEAVSEITGDPVRGVDLKIGVMGPAGSVNDYTRFSARTDDDGFIHFAKPKDAKVSVFTSGSVDWYCAQGFPQDSLGGKVFLQGDLPILLRVRPGPGVAKVPDVLTAYFRHSWREGPLRRLIRRRVDGLFELPHRIGRHKPMCEVIAEELGFLSGLPTNPKDPNEIHDVELLPFQVVEGRVVDATTKMGIEGVLVSAHSVTGDRELARAGRSTYLMASARSDPLGQFRLVGVHGKHYELRALTEMGGTGFAAVTADQDRAPVPVTLIVDQAGTLEVIVTDHEQPAMGYRGVLLSAPDQPEWRASFRTGADGIALLPAMPTGQFDLKLSPPSQLPLPFTVSRPPFAKRIVVDPHVVTRFKIELKEPR